jgi:VanZ family protein
MTSKRPSQEDYLSLPLVPFWIRICLVVTAVGGLVYFSVVPAPGTGTLSYGPFGVFPYSVWLHLLGYMGLSIALAYASHDVYRPSRQVLVRVFILTVGCGTAVELIQFTLPTRTFSVFDILVNAVGAGLGVSLWYVVDRLVGFQSLNELVSD